MIEVVFDDREDVKNAQVPGAQDRDKFF